MINYVTNVGNNYLPEPEDNVLKSIFSQYERVIIESLITSFGLDFMVGDQHGGDVDTIHNVRQIDIDPEMKYKNAANKTAYDNRGEYNRSEYHEKNPFYHKLTDDAKKGFNERGEWIKDGYVDGNKVAYNKALPEEQRAELDHILAAKGIHDDRGRVLSGKKGSELANNEDNLVFTNMKLNNNMRDKTVEEYIKWCEEHPEQVNYSGKRGEPLPESVKENLRREYKRAHDKYESKVAQAYYTSPKFVKDLSKAAVTRGAQMGIKQALGFVFAEIWFAVKEEFERLDVSFGLNMDLRDFFTAIGNGVKRGYENAKSKYKDIFERFLSGSISGVLASVTTTICNIFFTTAKNVVKIIRLSYASLVQTAKILFINPENYTLGDQMKAAAKTLAMGASIVVGSLVTEAIGKTAIGTIPVVGGIASNFCGALVSGIMSCTMLYFFDRNKEINALVEFMNKCENENRFINDLKQVEAEVNSYAAKLMKIDIDKFSLEAVEWQKVSLRLEADDDEQKLNEDLKAFMRENGISLPWEETHDSFDSFMNDKIAVLKFS